MATNPPLVAVPQPALRPVVSPTGIPAMPAASNMAPARWNQGAWVDAALTRPRDLQLSPLHIQELQRVVNGGATYRPYWDRQFTQALRANDGGKAAMAYLKGK